MVMTCGRLSCLHWCIGRDGPGWPVRTCYIYLFEIRVFIGFPPSVRWQSNPHPMSKIYYNGYGRYAALILWHNLVGPGRSDRTFIFLCVTWKLLFQYEIIISPPSLVNTYCTGDGRCVFMLFGSMEQSPLPWTNRRYVRISVCLNLVVLLAFDPL